MFTIEQKSLTEIKSIIDNLLADPLNLNIPAGTIDPSDYQNIEGLENIADSSSSIHLYIVGKLNDEIISISAASKFFDPVSQKNKILHRLNYVKPTLQGKNIGHAMMKFKADYFQSNNWNDDISTVHFVYVPIIFDNPDDFFTGLGWDLYTVNEYMNNAFIGYKTTWDQYKDIADAQVAI